MSSGIVLQLVYCLDFLMILEFVRGKKKKIVKTAAPDVVHVRKLSRYEGTLICGC